MLIVLLASYKTKWRILIVLSKTDIIVTALVFSCKTTLPDSLIKELVLLMQPIILWEQINRP